MKAFHCDRCGSLVFFENVQCVKCTGPLGFLPDVMDLGTLESAPGGTWRALTPAARGRTYRQCINSQQHQVCNWLSPLEDANEFCLSCRLNQTIPDLAVPENQDRWHKLEMAKRRVVYTLIRLNLSTEGVPRENRPPLRFSFLSDPVQGPPVITGHDQGLITINIAEADDPERERRRINFGEPYRTLLGHLRHEIAHYYWDQLIANTSRLARFRELFGNETHDYATALQTYYRQGAPQNWQIGHVSAYASSHPWEDWAETWAHYLHIVDTMETAASFGITLKPKHPDAKAMTSDPGIIDESNRSLDGILKQWLPLTYVLNSLNRGMGLPDLYPFVLSKPVIEKLRFIHEVVLDSGSTRR